MRQRHDRLQRNRGRVRPVWLAALAMLLSGGFADAETAYVSGHREINLRTGPSVGHRIIALLRTGNQMQVLGQEGEYNLVALPDGRQGYVLKSLLTGEPPPQRQIADLSATVDTQARELDRLRHENRRLVAANDKLNKDNLSASRRLRELQQESTAHRRDMRLWWFLAGAGVLLIGWLLGWTRVRLGRKARARSFT